MACLAIDIGNTSTAIAVVEAGHVLVSTHLRGGIRAEAAACRQQLQTLFCDHHLSGTVIASVAPSVNADWQRLVMDVLGQPPHFVSHTSPLGLVVDYPAPDRVGADRLANSAGAVARYGAPVIVADFGTALTFDIVDPRPAYIGGVIAPGLPLMTDYLCERTELLPHIDPHGPVAAIGRSTEDAMMIGACVGYRGMVREILAHIRQSDGMGTAPLVATGGYAAWALQDYDEPYTLDPELTLRGLGEVVTRVAGEPPRGKTERTAKQEGTTT
jgi:type III pantothenate kinase